MAHAVKLLTFSIICYLSRVRALGTQKAREIDEKPSGEDLGAGKARGGKRGAIKTEARLEVTTESKWGGKVRDRVGLGLNEREAGAVARWQRQGDPFSARVV